jgi:large conductance mechanosensitive channel
MVAHRSSQRAPAGRATIGGDGGKEDSMSNQRKGVLGEFKEFLLRGNVVDLAVAVVIGAAFGAVVTAFVADIITPIVAAIFGKPDFSTLHFTINNSTFRYGDFLNALITFLAIAAAVFFFVVKPLNYLLEVRKRRMAAGGVEDESTLSDEALLLTEIRDLLRAQRDAS